MSERNWRLFKSDFYQRQLFAGWVCSPFRYIATFCPQANRGARCLGTQQRGILHVLSKRGVALGWLRRLALPAANA
jgi:hypothetical protein